MSGAKFGTFDIDDTLVNAFPDFISEPLVKTPYPEGELAFNPHAGEGSTMGIVGRCLHRGLIAAQARSDSEMIDCFQHAIDEWERTPGAWESYQEGMYA